MGNKESRPQNTDTSENVDRKLFNTVNHIAAKLIYKMNFQELTKLDDMAYCNRLLILTNKAIKANLKDLEITYLYQRIKNNKPFNAIKKGKVSFINKDKTDILDVKNKVTKHRMCIGIAKYYIKILHLFASIVKAINPLFVYKDVDNKKQVVPLKDFKKINKNYVIKKGIFNICSRRIEELKPAVSLDKKVISIKRSNCNMNKVNSEKKIHMLTGGAEMGTSPIKVVDPNPPVEQPLEQAPQIQLPEIQPLVEPPIQPDDNKPSDIKPSGIRDMYKQIKQENKGIQTGDSKEKDGDKVILPSQYISTKKLGDEPGIKELEMLYNDVINIETNKIKFDKMSPETKKEFDENLKLFYKIFTGKSKVPEDIKTFSDIPLKDFHNQELCKDENSQWNQKYEGSMNNKLFRQYGKHVQMMINKVQKTEEELIQILNMVFVYDLKHPSREVSLHPELNEMKLNKEIIPKARKIITQMYIQCERDYQKGLGIFEGIIKSKMIDATKQRIKKLDKLGDKLIGENK